MLHLFELSVYGKLYFFEYTLSPSQFNEIEKYAHKFFKQNPHADITFFVNAVYEKLNIRLTQVQLHMVISV